MRLIWPSPAWGSNCVSTNWHHSGAASYLSLWPWCVHRLRRQRAGARDRYCENVLCSATTTAQCATASVRSSLADAHPSSRRQSRLLLLSAQCWSVLNAAAWLVFSARHSKYIMLFLCHVLWLRVPEQIRFRLCVLTYCCLNGTALPYLADGIPHLSGGRRRRPSSPPLVGHDGSRRPARSSIYTRRPGFLCRRCTGVEQFAVGRPSSTTFRRKLKTFLFKWLNFNFLILTM